MQDLLKISGVFAVILILLRRKWTVGYVMFIASGAIVLLYLMPPMTVVLAVKDTLVDPITIKFTFAMVMLKSFEMVLRENKILATMTDACRKLLCNKKAVIVSMPLLIGLLPSIGGAYFSAPMVAESTKEVNISPEEKTFINYWYRHPWEFISPLYPGLLLAAAISDIPLWKLSAVNIPITLTMAAAGFVFNMRNISGRFESCQIDKTGRKDLLSFLPVISALLLVVLFRIELHYAIVAILIALFVVFKYDFKNIVRTIKHGVTLDIIILIVSIMLFKEIMDVSGAVKNLSSFLVANEIPAAPLLFILPFITGLLTGLSVGFIGSTFPLLISIVGGASISAIVFAFAAGFLGVMLSPVHVCFVLTREYFKADMWGTYKKLIAPWAAVFFAAFAEYLLLK